MFRLFGKEKPKAPTATLEDASNGINKRTNEVDEKIKKLDEELRGYQQKLSKMKAGPAKTSLQKRALDLLKRKKMYEKSRDNMQAQSFNIDQTRFTQDSLKDTITTVEAMKSAGETLKQQFKQVDIDSIEDLHDDMSDLMTMNDEVNEVMGRSYGVPEELDEDDLMSELNALEDDMNMEEANEVPSYLINADSAAKKDKDEVKSKDGVETDEFGLPKIPARRLEV